MEIMTQTKVSIVIQKERKNVEKHTPQKSKQRF
jgi:hypothetical protein